MNFMLAPASQAWPIIDSSNIRWPGYICSLPRQCGAPNCFVVSEKTMSKVFLRSYYPYPTGESIPPTGVKLNGGAGQWAKFEGLLKNSLSELGHDVHEQIEHPSIADDFRKATVTIYAHKTRRDVAGNLFYKQMHLPELFTIDHIGWGADHSKMQQPPDLRSIEAAEAERFVAARRHKFLTTGASKLGQPQRDPSISLPDDYIFVPTQTPRDYVQVHHAPISVLSFVQRIAGWADETRQNVVFKLHPGLYHTSVGDNRIIETVQRLAATSDYVFCRQANVHDLIVKARGVFAINSGVGFESLIHGKPVVTFGNCDYQWVTFRASRENLNEAREFVVRYSEDLRQKAYRFIYYYFFHHAFSIEDEYLAQSSRRLTDYLAMRLANDVDFHSSSKPSFSQTTKEP
jgi:hypothetical protein